MWQCQCLDSGIQTWPWLKSWRDANKLLQKGLCRATGHARRGMLMKFDDKFHTDNYHTLWENENTSFFLYTNKLRENSFYGIRIYTILLCTAHVPLVAIFFRFCTSCAITINTILLRQNLRTPLVSRLSPKREVHRRPLDCSATQRISFWYLQGYPQATWGCSRVGETRQPEEGARHCRLCRGAMTRPVQRRREGAR